jgi:hypothetical protein
MAGTNGGPRAVIVFVVADREFPFGVIDSTTRCDLALIDAILRMRLAGTRYGWSIRLTNVDRDLRDLVELVGLTEYLEL